MSRDPGNVDERTKPCNRLHIADIKSVVDKHLVLKMFTVEELRAELSLRQILARAKASCCDHEWQHDAASRWCNKCGHGL